MGRGLLQQGDDGVSKPKPTQEHSWEVSLRKISWRSFSPAALPFPGGSLWGTELAYFIPLVRLGKVFLAKNVTESGTLQCKITSIYVGAGELLCYLSICFDICEHSGAGRKLKNKNKSHRKIIHDRAHSITCFLVFFSILEAIQPLLSSQGYSLRTFGLVQPSHFTDKESLRPWFKSILN